MQLTVNLFNSYFDYRAVLLVEFGIFTLMAAFAAYQDYRHRSISGELCLALLVMLGADALLYKNLAGALAVIVSALFIYAPFELDFFSDADVLPFTIFFVLFAKPVSNFLLLSYALTAAGCSALACLLPVWVKSRREGSSFGMQHVPVLVMLPVWLSIMTLVVLAIPQVTAF